MIPGLGRSPGKGKDYLLQNSGLENSMDSIVGFPCGSADKESTCNVGDLGSILDWEDPLEKGKATYSRILAWRIPWTV